MGNILVAGKDAATENAVGFDASLLQMLLEEIRILRTQLQKSIDANIALREKLEQQLESPLDSSSMLIFTYYPFIPYY